MEVKRTILSPKKLIKEEARSDVEVDEGSGETRAVLRRELTAFQSLEGLCLF